MPRPAADIDAANELGLRLTELHAQHQEPKFDRMAKDFYRDYTVDVSGEQLRKMHKGLVDPNSVAVEVLAGLTVYYGCSPRELGPVAAERLNWLRTLDMSDWQWITDCAGQLHLPALVA